MINVLTQLLFYSTKLHGLSGGSTRSWGPSFRRPERNSTLSVSKMGLQEGKSTSPIIVNTISSFLSRRRDNRPLLVGSEGKARPAEKSVGRMVLSLPVSSLHMYTHTSRAVKAKNRLPILPTSFLLLNSCERCESGSEMGSHMSSVACPTCGVGTCVPCVDEDGRVRVYRCTDTSNCSAETQGGKSIGF